MNLLLEREREDRRDEMFVFLEREREEWRKVA